MPSQAKFHTIASQDGAGTADWILVNPPEYLEVVDDLGYAAEMPLGTSQSNILYLRGWGFTAPDNAGIEGLEFRAWMWADASGAATTVMEAGSGTDDSSGGFGLEMTHPFESGLPDFGVTGAPQLFLWGSPTETWGIPNLSPGLVNGDDFAIALALVFNDIAESGGFVILDKAEATLYWTEASATGDSLSLFVRGFDCGSGSAPLFLQCEFSEASDSVPLYLEADPYPASGNLPLFAWGAGVEDRSLPLFVQAAPLGTPSSSLPLFAHGFEGDGSGLFGSFPLYLEGGAFGRSLNLFLAAAQLGEESRSLPLYVSGEAHQADCWVPLYVHNDQSGVTSSLPLYVRGSGVTDGAIPFSSSLNLVLMRNPAGMVPLYVRGPGEEASGHVPMYVSGAYGSEGELELVMPNVVGYATYTADLYVSGW